MLPGPVKQLHHYLVFIKLDDVDGGEVLADAKQVRDWKPKKVSEDGPVDSSMANEGDRVIRMTGSDFHKFRNDPVMQFLETFSAVGAKQFGLFEAFVHFAGMLPAEVGQAFALPFAKGQFAQFGKGYRFQFVVLCDQTSSLIGPLKVAGVNRADGLVLQCLSQLTGLFDTGVRQGDIKVTVHANLVRIGGFTVAEQIDTASGCSLEGAGPGIGWYMGGRHRALVKDIKKGGKPQTWTCHPFE